MPEPISNPKAPEVHKNVPADHPSLAVALKNAAKRNVPKEQAMKLTGAPMEVVERYYREEKK